MVDGRNFELIRIVKIPWDQHGLPVLENINVRSPFKETNVHVLLVLPTAGFGPCFCGRKSCGKTQTLHPSVQRLRKLNGPNRYGVRGLPKKHVEFIFGREPFFPEECRVPDAS